MGDEPTRRGLPGPFVAPPGRTPHSRGEIGGAGPAPGDAAPSGGPSPSPLATCTVSYAQPNTFVMAISIPLNYTCNRNFLWAAAAALLAA